jgi:Family of unknown function (DUF5998)
MNYRGPAGQDGCMSDTKAASDMQSAIERSGYYPGLVSDAVSTAVGTEPVISFVVHHDAHFDPGMEVRRHMTVMALTPTRLVYSHTDEYPADEADPESRPQAETSTEAVRHGRISSVALTRVIPDPASYVPGVTTPTEVVLTIGWNVLSHIEIEAAHCGDENCEADHGYTGTMTADDLTVRVSAAADGPEAVQQVMSFARALTEATSGS